MSDNGDDDNGVNDLKDSIKPIYEFEWDDGSVRRTDEIANKEQAKSKAVEELARLGRNDPECTVTLIGYQS